MQPQKIRKRHFLDYSIFVPYVVLVFTGLIMIYSATSYRQLVNGENPLTPLVKQVAFWMAGLVIMWLLYHLRPQLLKSGKLIKFSMLTTGILIIAARLFFPAVNGAYGWIQLPGIGTVQPAEFLKVLLVWYFAYYFSKGRFQNNIAYHDWSGLKEVFKLPLVVVGLVALLPDMGNVVILLLVILVMILSSGISYRYAYSVVLAGIGVGFAGIEFILRTKGKLLVGPLSYIYKRFEAMADTFHPDIVKDSGLQLANSYYAFHNGGLFGLGLGNSVEKKGYLPFAYTDFIFSVLVEELGLIIGVMILGLLVFMICRMILVGIRATKPFNSMIAIGMGCMVLIQLFINLGGVIGLIPSTGVTFPFISQGGTSLLVLTVAVGFVLNVSANEAQSKLEAHLLYQQQVGFNEINQ